MGEQRRQSVPRISSDLPVLVDDHVAGNAGDVKGFCRLTSPVSRLDPDAPKALCTVAPLTTQNRGSPCEVAMPKVPWLKHQLFANVQALTTYEHHELLGKRGRFDVQTMGSVKDAIRWALDL